MSYIPRRPADSSSRRDAPCRALLGLAHVKDAFVSHDRHVHGMGDGSQCGALVPLHRLLDKIRAEGFKIAHLADRVAAYFVAA